MQSRSPRPDRVATNEEATREGNDAFYLLRTRVQVQLEEQAHSYEQQMAELRQRLETKETELGMCQDIKLVESRTCRRDRWQKL